MLVCIEQQQVCLGGKTMKSPVIILHGWSIDPQNQLKWKPFIEELERSGVEVHFLPLPGLSIPTENAWRLNDYVHWLQDQLKSYKSVVLLGHSFGGQLAIRYTSILPEKVQRLVLIDASGIRPFTVKAKLKRAVFQTVAKIGKVIFPFDVGRAVLHKFAREKDYVQASPIMRETMRNVLADEILLDLPKIRVETLIIWGDQDKATPVTHAEVMSAKIPHSQLHFISGARHSPQFTHVHQAVERVRSFLAQENKG